MTTKVKAWRLAWQEPSGNTGHGDWWDDIAWVARIATAYKKEEPRRIVWIEGTSGVRTEIIQEEN